MVVSQKLGINLPQDLATQLLCIQPKDAQSYHKDIYSTVFIAELFIVFRMWKQTRCLSTEKIDEENVIHLLNGVLLISFKMTS